MKTCDKCIHKNSSMIETLPDNELSVTKAVVVGWICNLLDVRCGYRKSSRLSVTMLCRRVPIQFRTMQDTTYWHILPWSVRKLTAKQGNFLLRIRYVCSISTRVRHKAVLYLSLYLIFLVMLE